jgi:Lsr2 protein
MIPIVFCETRALAEEWTYRYLAAAAVWAETESAAIDRIGLIPGQGGGEDGGEDGTAEAPDALAPSTAEVRAWARANGIEVPDRGRLRPEVHRAWRDAHRQ